MTDRQTLHELIDKLPEAELDRVRNLLEQACESKNGGPESDEVATDFESLERRAREHFANVTQEEWDKLPEDLIENLDHYLYGVPKKK